MAVLVQLIDGNSINKFEITEQGLTIGRSVKNQVYLDDPSVSQNHAKIERKDLTDGAFIFFIHDLQSTNHTYVNNKIVNTLPLSDQDMIVIGTKNFKFIDEVNDQLAQTKVFKKSWIPGLLILKD